MVADSWRLAADIIETNGGIVGSHMSEELKSQGLLEQARELMREWETYKMEYDPEFARTYAGQWVVWYRGQVVAHGKDATEVAQAAPVIKYPSSVMFYVPTLEQQEGVWVLHTDGSRP